MPIIRTALTALALLCSSLAAQATPVDDALAKLLADVQALQSLLAAPPVVVPPVVPPAPTESADLTTVMPGSGAILDSTGMTWTLGSDGTILANGAVAYNGWQSNQMVYHSHQVDILGLDGNWYGWKNNAFTGPIASPLPTPPPPIPGTVVTPSFYVDPNGSDSNTGLASTSAFQTLEKAQRAMQAGTLKHVYLRQGTWKRTQRLELDSADSGEVWAYYPPDGPDKAILDGGNSVDVIIHSSGASNLVIDGLATLHPQAFGIELTNGSGNVIQNSEVAYNSGSGPDFDGWPPILSIANCTQCKVLHNYVHDAISMGIGAYAYGATDRLTGSLIQGNVVLRAAQQTSDAGAIYINMHSSWTSGGAVTVDGNFTRDTGTVNTWGIHDVYLDDTSSNVSVTNNVLGPYPSNAGQNGQPYPLNSMNLLFLTYGTNNTFSNNIVDLGTSGTTNAATFAGLAGQGQNNNTYTGNIVIGNFTGQQTGNSSGHQGQYVADPGGSSNLSITGNLYFNYAGGALRTDTYNGTADTKPIQANPLLSGAGYALDPASPAFKAIKFTDLARAWGPPGFIVPPGLRSSP